MDRSRLLYLIQRYSENTATPAELKELSDFIAESPDDELFTDVMMEQMGRDPLINKNIPAFEVLADRVVEITRPRRSYKWMWAAACMLLVMAGAIYIRLLRKEPVLTAKKEEKTAPAVVVPGKTGAILTLSDGSTIVLDSMGTGKVASQNGADVLVQQGKLAYVSSGKVSGSGSGAMVYNTLSTPTGRQYHIQLPDGTEVWLNAASSIHYPTVFSGTERVVDITGEAYFEVAKDAARPFKVKAGQGAQIDVLGTHFNVNAYSNEPAIATTLLEGSVRFRGRGGPNGEEKSELLKPGQQTQYDQASHALTVANDVETAQVVAWKNGKFDFNDMGLKKVMQQLERWYDIDVVYEKNVPDIKFFGKMTENIPLNDLLIILEKSKVHFQMQGRKLIVKP